MLTYADFKNRIRSHERPENLDSTWSKHVRTAPKTLSISRQRLTDTFHWPKRTDWNVTLVSLRNRTQEEEDGRTLVCDKRDKAISYAFCRDLHLTSMFSGLLQKDLFKGKWILAKSYFKQNYCHACHTRFAVFFPFPSCCVSSLLCAEFVALQEW